MLQPPIHAPPEGDNTGSIGFWAYTVTEELGSGPGFPPPTAPGDRTARYPLRARTVTFRPGTLTAMRRHSPPNTVFDGV